MSRKLTSKSSLENLKREAKRWLKALRDNDAEARARFARVITDSRSEPTLRDVQHALAREYGYDGWTALAAAVETLPRDGGLTELLAAAERGDAARVSEILDAQPSLLNERGTLEGHTGQRTALHFGVRHAAVVRALLARGADPNIRDEGDNAVPLHFAAERLDLETIRMLVEHGSEMIGSGDDHELEIIGWATCFNPQYLGITPEERMRRRRVVVDYLLAHGGRHNIFSATAMGDTEAIRRVVAADPDVINRPMDATNHRRRPLHLAVVERQLPSLKTLLDLGADTGTRDAAGMTPLDQAAIAGDVAMADLLLERGAKLELPAAVALNRDVERVLAEDPNALQPGGRWETLIIRAAENAPAEIMESLIRLGASPNARDNVDTAVDGTWGYTALHAAAFRGDMEKFELLLRHGADPNLAETKYYGTPAGWADYAGHTEVRDRILAGPIGFFPAVFFDRIDRFREIFDRAPGMLNQPFVEFLPGRKPRDQWTDRDWPTALAYAALNNKTDAVRTLLELGAEVNVRDHEGRSLRERVADSGYAEILALLDAHAPAVVRRANVRNESREQLVARFLSNACPDHHVRGGVSHIVARQTANRILADTPDIARDSIYTAVVCGDIDEMRRILAERPGAAREKGGPKGSDEAAGTDFITEATPAAHPRWEPLLYLCFTRIDHAPSIDNAVEMAKLLLDHGADPNAYFMAGSSRYSPLTGVVGEGEENRLPHPHRDELARLLLERGAFPYDVQVLYNLHSTGKYLWFLELVHEITVKQGRAADWADPEWRMIDMGGYGRGALFILGKAVEHNDLELARWALEHGATPNPKPLQSWRRLWQTESLYEVAVTNGLAEMAELLARHGARRDHVSLDREQAFTAACMRLDRAAAARMLEEHPQLRESHGVLHTAAKFDNAAAAALIIDLGTSPNVENRDGWNALHVAAWEDSPAAGRLLIDRGVDVDHYDRQHGNTPLGFALWGQRQRMIELLSHYGNDLWNLVLVGAIDRIRESLRENPKRANMAWPDEKITPLMRLPGDEDLAIDIIRVFLAHGVDTSVRNTAGDTAGDIAERRGMFRAAELLRR
jgi:ankyrin repeat protein